MTDYRTVRDIPDTYTLLTGDEANEITGHGSCAFSGRRDCGHLRHDV